MFCKVLAESNGAKHLKIADFIPEFDTEFLPTMDVDVLQQQLSAFGKEINESIKK